MKLFSRATQGDAENPDGAEAPAEDHAADEVLVEDAAASLQEAAVDPSQKTAELEAQFDASMKEMTNKIAKLSSTVEAAGQDRENFEEKMNRIEERMRKLSSLTEMISAQYNPFLGDGPQEMAQLKASGKPSEAQAPPEAHAPPEEKSSVSSDEGEHDNGREDENLTAEPSQAEEKHTNQTPNATPVPVLHGNGPHYQPSGAHLEHVEMSLTNSRLMLKWVEMLLGESRSREWFRELLGYYQAIGWIGEPVRDQLIAYADGLAVSEFDESASTAPDWRTNAELHERSLAFIQKLKGHGNPES